MYTVVWHNGRVCKVVGDIESIIQLTHMLENNKYKFKVSDCARYLKQSNFGYSGYKYWLNPREKF